MQFNLSYPQLKITVHHQSYMSNYHSKHPTWCFQNINVPNLDKIVADLTQIYNSTNYFIDTDKTFYMVDSSHPSWKNAPALQHWISAMNWNDRWVVICFVVTRNGCDDWPVHVDYPSTSDAYASINIPILNCEDSYTVFYDAAIDINKQIPMVLHNGQYPGVGWDAHSQTSDDTSELRNQGGFFCKPESAIEIARAESWKPNIINTTVPHRPIIPHNKERVMAAIRIRPELTDQDLKKLLG